jgi:threonine dehydrogenase-like Zn-dependent dehydrogenase
LVVFSAVHGQASLDLFRVHTQELEILGACNDQDLIDPALENMADPQMDLASLVTQQLPFAQWSKGFDLARRSKAHTLKVALTFGEPA